MRLRVFVYACVCLCVCFVSYVNVFLCLCLCSCLCVPVRVCMSLFLRVRVFWDDFQIIFYQISGPLWKLFGGFLEVAASRQPWPLPSRVEFHFEPFSYTFLHASWSPSWRQDRPSWSQDGAKLPNLAPRCAQDGQLGA